MDYAYTYETQKSYGHAKSDDLVPCWTPKSKGHTKCNGFDT